MRLAIKAHTQSAPFWTLILELSRDWGIPPWQIAGGVPLMWVIRAKVMKDILVECELKNARKT